jgi:8-oxo-dGTP diphosphatase
VTPSPETPIRVRVAAAIVEDGKILLVKHRKGDDEYWMLPGGGLEHGETLHAAAKRELEEETGYEIRPTRLLFVSESISPDKQRHILHACFLAERTGGAERACDDARVAGIGWLPLADIATARLYPAFGPEILEALQTPSNDEVYLGQRWV